MDNFFGTLFLDLSTFLKAEVPELRWIDQDFGQLEVFEYRPDVAFPCVLIDFPQAQFSNLSELSQLGDILISVRLGFAPFAQSHHGAPLNVREKALEYYTLEQKVYEKVQGWHNDHCQPLNRTNSQTEQRVSASGSQDASGLRVRVLLFTTSFEDHSAAMKYTKAPKPALEVDGEITT